MTRMYELIPQNGRMSFYGKAKVLIDEQGETLYSYDTPIIRLNKDGTLTRLYSGWSATTGTHIKSFCGLRKKEFFDIPMEQ